MNEANRSANRLFFIVLTRLPAGSTAVIANIHNTNYLSDNHEASPENFLLASLC